MMTHSGLLLILGGCLLGLLQFSIGIGIGLWMRRGMVGEAQQGRQAMLQAGRIAQRLQSLTDDVTSCVGEHRTKLDQASRRLSNRRGNQEQEISDIVVDVVGEIVRANQSLQTKLTTAENRLRQQATEIETHISRALTDPLTGLPNRREFNDRLEERMAAWHRRGEPFTLMMLDADHFKKLNDCFGHLAGDQILTAIGRALRSAVRREDAVARYGGEEFALLLPNTTAEQAAHVAKKVLTAVARIEIDHSGTRLTVTASAGLATIAKGEHAENLIERADAALYAAKTGGRNCAYLHDGVNCLPIADGKRPAKEAPAAAGSLAESDLEAPGATLFNEDDSDFLDGAGPAVLPPPEVSPELAKTCEELREFMEERQRQAVSATAS